MDRKRRPKANPAIEGMEGRVCLTGGVGNTFALVAGEVAANQTAEVKFTVAPGHFTRPGGRLVLGVDVTAQNGSTVDAKIASVGPTAVASQGQQARRARGLPTLRTAGSSAVLATLSGRSGNAFSTKIQGKNGTAGGLVVGFYLPGDANGNGVVDRADETIVRGLQGVSVSNADKYDFDADANRDGLINRVDLKYTRLNRGARTTITPVLTANLDPASDTGTADRVTTLTDVKFTGVASPGAVVTYKEVGGRTPDFTTTVDAAGNYVMNVKLAPGINTFRVTSVDAFGQTISGQISPVIVPTTS